MMVCKLVKIGFFSLSALALCACATSPLSENVGRETFGADFTAQKDCFASGKLLFDGNGRIVNAHGAGFLYDGDRYYMFGEHKLGGRLGNKSLVGVHCYSSADFHNWRDEGIALKMSDDPKSEIFVGTILERPKVLFNAGTKKYVMFMHLEFRKAASRESSSVSVMERENPDYSTARIGFAVSDKVSGPYEYVGSTRLHSGKFPMNCDADFEKLVKANKNSDLSSVKNFGSRIENGTAELFFAKCFKDGQYSRDFTAFLDDDGKAYIISSSEDNASLYIFELRPDWLGFTGKYSREMVGAYNEAPAVFKSNGKYYMFTSHCTGWAPNAGRVSSAPSMFGPWKEIGNPSRGKGEKATAFRCAAGADTTFRSQSSRVIKVQGTASDALIYWGDRWNGDDAADGRYVMLPVEWEGENPIIKWYDKWDLSFFEKK